MTRPWAPVLLLAVVSIAGIAAMLVASSAWDWLFLALAALPLGLGAAVVVWRSRRRPRTEQPPVPTQALE